MNKKAIALTTLLTISFASPALAGGSSDSGSSSNNGSSNNNGRAADLRPQNSTLSGNQAQTQHNSTNLDSASFVNQNVTQNVGQAAVVRFPGGLVCPKPMMMVNANYVDSSADWYNYNTGSSAFSAGVSFIMPFGTGRCNDYADRLYERQVFKNEAELVNICAALISNNVALNPEKFPSLSDSCSGVQVRRPDPAPQVAPPPPAPQLPAPPAPPVIRRTRG